jgi:hypothetical protein
MKRLRIWVLALLLLAGGLALKTFRFSPSISPLSTAASVDLVDRSQFARLPEVSVFPAAPSISVPPLPPTVSLGSSGPFLPQTNLALAIPNSPPPPRPAASSADLPLVVIAADNVKTLQPEQIVMMRYLAEDFLAASESAPMLHGTSGPKRRRPPKTDWERAIELSDARFQAMFGQDAFNAFQLERATQAAAAQ